MHPVFDAIIVQFSTWSKWNQIDAQSVHCKPCRTFSLLPNVNSKTFLATLELYFISKYFISILFHYFLILISKTNHSSTSGKQCNGAVITPCPIANKRERTPPQEFSENQSQCLLISTWVLLITTAYRKDRHNTRDDPLKVSYQRKRSRTNLLKQLSP